MSPRLACLVLALVLAAVPATAPLASDLDAPSAYAPAHDLDLRSARDVILRSRHAGRLVGAVVGSEKADPDTLFLLGGPDRLDGRFEDASGLPAWHGWTHEDATALPCMWQVSGFQAISGALSAWCGTYYGDDPGYGNNWDQQLVFRHHVADPEAATTVRWTLLLQNDTEVGYDYTRLAANRGGVWEELLAVDGNEFLSLDFTVDYAPRDYVGSAGDEVQLRIQVTTDVGWSDEDGIIDTDGACQVDDITVRVDGEVVSFEDCEDGVLDDWECVAPAVGDFTALYQGLHDLDPCQENSSPQVAFIDDGMVVPGTGGSPCVTWCYGPGGYIVNNSGGLAGPEYFLLNRLISPVLDVPAGMTDLLVMLDAYVHEELGAQAVWPGILYSFELRSTADPVGEPIAEQPWRWPGVGWYGGPAYVRHGGPDYPPEDLTALLEPGSVQVQVGISVRDWFQWYGFDGTPAPYLDNVAVVGYAANGPHLSTVDWHQAQDAFPDLGDLDYEDLGANSVRFDAATGADALVFWARTVRPGASLQGPPIMHVRMRPNAVFDAVRELPEGFVHAGGLVVGTVPGDSVFFGGDPPELVPDRYHFDLPDTGFFFPGDVIHWYVEARDEVAGDVGVTRLPADTTGLTDFAPLSPYPFDFRVRALPTFRSAASGDQPALLFHANAAAPQSSWLHALQWLGYRAGVDFDWFRVKASGGGVPSTLGHQATGAVLSGYSTLVSSSGSNVFGLLSVDVLVLESWFDRGDKHALLTGDDVVYSLARGDAAQQAFLHDHLGVAYLANDLVGLVGGQFAPGVRAAPENGVIARVEAWTAYAGCPDRPAVDGIEAVGSTVRLAEFLDPAGNGGAYPLAAATFHLDGSSGAEVVVMPYDLARVTAAPGWQPPAGMAGIPPRAVILDDILAAFGHLATGQPIAAPDALPFTVQVAPNPANPRVAIEFALPRAGEVRVDLYDVRGARVRRLLDEVRPAGGHRIAWDGADDAGRPVASGVYFCEVRAVGEQRVRKLTLVR